MTPIFIFHFLWYVLISVVFFLTPKCSSSRFHFLRLVSFLRLVPLSQVLRRPGMRTCLPDIRHGSSFSFSTSSFSFHQLAPQLQKTASSFGIRLKKRSTTSPDPEDVEIKSDAPYILPMCRSETLPAHTAWQKPYPSQGTKNES